METLGRSVFGQEIECLQLVTIPENCSALLLLKLVTICSILKRTLAVSQISFS